MEDRAEERGRMVTEQLEGRDIHDPRVLAAMAEVPRHRFVPAGQAHLAYEDGPLRLPHGQTISQPYVVAATAQALEVVEDDRILDVGTGSGYAAAVLARLGGHVVSIERVPDLANTAAALLAELGYDSIEVHCADGTKGWDAAAPYDCIAVAAAAQRLPDALVEQLADGGRLVIPIGRRWGGQWLELVRRRGDETTQTKLFPVAYVPLISDTES